MRKSRCLMTLLCIVTMVAGVAGCSKDVKLPDVSSLGEPMVVSREEGSGTRTEFESIIGTSGEGSDTTAASTDEVEKIVSANENAVGYLAYSSAHTSSGVRALEINGVAASNETIKNGSYPLCRNYYLAYSGELSDAERDFITYIMSAGQKIAGSYAVAVKDSTTFLSDRSGGSITISGSSSAAPLLTALAEDYKTFNANVDITINVTDSTKGLTAAMRGECDIAMSSRELKDYEEELLTKKAIARDAIAIIVNSKNPVTNLSVGQIKKLYDRDCESWQELG